MFSEKCNDIENLFSQLLKHSVFFKLAYVSKIFKLNKCYADFREITFEINLNKKIISNVHIST